MSYFVSERFSKLLIFIGVFLLLIFILCFGYKSVFFDLSVPIKTDIFGQFGDIVGGVIGSLWALAGVILFYAGLTEQRKDIKTNQDALEKQISALNNQKEEMELQRLEYKMARQVFEEQREALKEQAKTSKIQQFESNFYSLLNIYIGIRNNVVSENSNFISDVNKELRKLNLRNINEKNKITIITSKYLEIYLKDKDKISHYLKTVYRIYKVIDEQSDLTIEKKYFYSKIVRSQFTEDELYLIYYNAHSTYGVNFRPLILKFNILKHLMVMSKVEFNFLSDDIMSISNNRYDYLSWLDDFFINNCASMYDIGIDEPSFSSIYKCNKSNSQSIIEIVLNDNDDIELIFTNSISDLEIFLGFDSEDELCLFINHYLYDRFLNSSFEKIIDHDVFSYKKINNDWVFTLETEKKLKIVSDYI